MSFLNQEAVLERFRKHGALLDGHFRLSSGLHSPRYLQSALVLQQPGEAQAFGEALADLARELGVVTVLSPALGGLIIGHEVGRALGTRAIFVEREAGALTLRRGFVLVPGERVFVVEDVVTTGRSTRETVAVVRSFGAEVVGAGAIIDRSDTEGQGLDVPFVALVKLDVPTYAPESCPMCAAAEPVVKPGSRPA